MVGHSHMRGPIGYGTIGEPVVIVPQVIYLRGAGRSRDAWHADLPDLEVEPPETCRGPLFAVTV